MSNKSHLSRKYALGPLMVMLTASSLHLRGWTYGTDDTVGLG